MSDANDQTAAQAGGAEPESAGLAALRAACGAWIVAASERGSEMRIQVDPDALSDVCRYLRDDPAQCFDYPGDMLALDTGAEIHVIYRVHAMAHNRTAIIEVHLNREDPAVPTLNDVWPGFNWFEREAYDLYGIAFDGHPNQGDSTRMRILLPKDWEGFPFRKDYEPEFTDNPLFGPQRTN